MTKVAINGFGRIGRLAARVILTKHANELELVVINTSGSMDTAGWAHLLNNYTTYHRFEIPVTYDQNNLIIASMGLRIPVLAQKDPALLPWGQYQVDVVLECTGKFTDEEGAKKHALAGAKKVIISAPHRGGNIGTFVLGVNNAQGEIISNASCTTNCITPVAAVIHNKFGITKALMTTVHAYTDDQVLQDGSHRDLRRARAAAANIVPTSTGAALATTEVIPELRGLFDGISLRVPIITGSITDFVFVTAKKTTKEEVNQVLQEATRLPQYKDILGMSGIDGIPLHLVSSDIIGTSYSAIVDPEYTQVIDGDLVKVLAWYDNEWGYTNRLVEQAVKFGNS